MSDSSSSSDTTSSDETETTHESVPQPSTPRNREASEQTTPRPGFGGVPPRPMAPANESVAVQRDLELAEPIYERCFGSIAEGIPCNGDFGVFSAKKCWRCSKGGAKCYALHEFLIPAANRYVRARDTVTRLNLDGSGATGAQRNNAQAELNAAVAHCAERLKRFHTNFSKTEGNQRTPRGRRVTKANTGSSSTTDAMALEEMQKIRGLMEDGLNMLGSVMANGLNANHRTVLSKIASKRTVLWEEEEEEDEDEEDDDDMDE